MTRGRHRRRSLRPVLVAVLGLLTVAGLTLPGADGGYLARITNDANTSTTRTYFTCTNAAVGEPGTTALFAYPFGDASGTVVTDVTGNAGVTGTYGTGITYGVANGGVCPRDNKTVVSLNGTTGYILGPSTVSAAPTTFSEEIWFKTSSKQGKLIGFGSGRSALASLSYDRHLYIDTSGRLVFGVGVANTITSAGNVADGTWHQAVGVLSPTAGMALYLDGALVASNPGVTAGLGYLLGGYWRIGFDSLALWPNAGSGYVNGQLAYAAVYGYALSATQVIAHYRAGIA